MPTIFTTAIKMHLFLEQNREDILYAMQIPVALTALATLFFLT
ncbi:MAG: hypothetical protein ACE5DZ_02430 [Mariprofundus sp.]